MAGDFENMGYEAVPKIVSVIKMAAESDNKVPEALRTIPKVKMAADFENKCYEAEMKTISMIKMAAESD